jgi:anti-sigma B factor antagonist
MDKDLKVIDQIIDDNIHIKLIGDIDIYTSQYFKDTVYSIIDHNIMDLKFDCEELRYIDSTGLGILVGMLKKANSSGKKIYLYKLKDSIRKLFLITELDKLFVIE